MCELSCALQPQEGLEKASSPPRAVDARLHGLTMKSCGENTSRPWSSQKVCAVGGLWPWALSWLRYNWPHLRWHVWCRKVLVSLSVYQHYAQYCRGLRIQSRPSEVQGPDCKNRIVSKGCSTSIAALFRVNYIFRRVKKGPHTEFIIKSVPNHYTLLQNKTWGN